MTWFLYFFVKYISFFKSLEYLGDSKIVLQEGKFILISLQGSVFKYLFDPRLMLYSSLF